MGTVTKKTNKTTKPSAFEVVLSPAASIFLGEHKGVRERLKQEAAKGSEAPIEVVIDEGKAEDGRKKQLVAFMNPYVRTAYVDYLDKLRLHSSEPTREKAVRTVSLGIGSRPDLPTGTEYVERISHIWKGLMPRG